MPVNLPANLCCWLGAQKMSKLLSEGKSFGGTLVSLVRNTALLMEMCLSSITFLLSSARNTFPCRPNPCTHVDKCPQFHRH